MKLRDCRREYVARKTAAPSDCERADALPKSNRPLADASPLGAQIPRRQHDRKDNWSAGPRQESPEQAMRMGSQEPRGMAKPAWPGRKRPVRHPPPGSNYGRRTNG